MRVKKIFYYPTGSSKFLCVRADLSQDTDQKNKGLNKDVVSLSKVNMSN